MINAEAEVQIIASPPLFICLIFGLFSYFCTKQVGWDAFFVSIYSSDRDYRKYLLLISRYLERV